MSIGRFIAGVGALIWDPACERYLFLRRSAMKDFGAGAWECVTGRVDQGESFEQALRREVREEIGIEVTIDFLIAITHFYRGERLPENELLGIMFCCSISEPDMIKLSEEHDAHAWLTFLEASEQFARASQDAWLLRTLEWAEEIRLLTPPVLLASFRSRGFELNS